MFDINKTKFATKDFFRNVCSIDMMNGKPSSNISQIQFWRSLSFCQQLLGIKLFQYNTCS